MVVSAIESDGDVVNSHSRTIRLQICQSRNIDGLCVMAI